MGDKFVTPKNLKDIRLQVGLTQAQLSDFFGLSGKSRIAEYESGVRNPSSGILKLYELIKNKKIKPPGAKNAKSKT